MRNYIILNNKKSDTISGLIIQELPAISKPAQRTQIETIDGRDGDIVTPLGYAAYDKTFTIGLYGNFDINEIIAYFATQGQVIFSNEPNKYYNYQIVDQIDYERLVRYKVATVTMHVQPFKYSSTETPIIVDSSDTISGEGSNIALANTAEAPFNTLRHKGNATQKTLSGKNLLNVSPTYSVTGYVNLAPLFKDLEVDTDYTISVGAIEKGGDNYPAINLAGGAPWWTFSPNGSYTFRWTSTPTSIWLYSNGASAATSTGVTSVIHNLMIEKSSTKTDYEEYCGGIPSPNPDYPQDIQVVTGESTIKITGKNLFSGDFAQFNNQGGTGSLYAYFKLASTGLYSLTLKAKNTLTHTGRYLGFTTNGGNADASYRWVYANLDAMAGQVFTLSNKVGDNYLGFVSMYPANSADLQWLVDNFDIQLEAGSTTAYEPYKEQEHKINLGGTNLIDISTLVAGYIQSSGLPTISQSYGEMRSDFIAVEPNTTYTFSIQATTDTYPSWFGIGEYTTNNTDGFIRRDTQTTTTATSYTFTTADTAAYIIVSARNLQHATKIQLEKNDKVTPYVPYVSYKYELAKIGDYADEPIKVDGTWYIRRAIGKVVFNGTEAWAVYGFSSELRYSFNINISGKKISSSVTDLLCDKYTVLSSSGTTPADQDKYTCRGTTYNSVIYLFTPKSAIAGATEQEVIANFKTWLSTHNTTLYYVLATPTDEAITDQSLIDALDELHDQAHAYKGHTHITATAADGNAPAVLAVDVNEDNESTVTNAGNTTSRPIITIYGQGDIGVYINDVEVLDIALNDEQYITLDSVEMEAYKDTTANLKNRLVTGDYSKLALNAGDNKIRFTGKVTKYEISKYSRWL